MGRMLKAGVIGLGIGEQHILGYQQHPQCEVVALCDRSEQKREEVGSRYPRVRMVSRAEEVLDDPEIDVVSIATYDDSHYEYVIRALERGKHVFVEKPVCLYPEHARHIRETLQKHPVLRLSSNLVLRTSQRFLALKRLIDEGKLGDLYYAEADYNYGRLQKITEGWRGKIPGYSGVFGGGIHVVDLLLWLTGGTVIEVSGYGNAIASHGSGFANNDLVVSMLKFNSGLIAKVGVNLGCVAPHFHALSLYGTKATFVNKLGDGLLYTSRDPDHRPDSITAEYPGLSEHSAIPSFIDAILGHGQPVIGEEDVFRSMSVCFAIEKAHRGGGLVQVEYI